MIWNETNDASFSNLVHMFSLGKISDFVKIDETLFNFTSTLVQRDSGSQTEEDYSSIQVRGFRFDQPHTSHLFQHSAFPRDLIQLTFLIFMLTKVETLNIIQRLREFCRLSFF